MSFISYAQNFEDVMLWRALQHVERGFYIDVGANDPQVDSVTQAFYERGWRGINIEPLVSHWKDLQRERPQDVNLRCAAGESQGELELWEAEVRGWATLAQDVVNKHEQEGYGGEFYKVPVVPLTQICAEHVHGDIHFLKIDVEGFEKSVLKGMDFSRFRPWVVVVEATEPNSTVENYQMWEPDLLPHGYRFVYADGLNRYYLADEHTDLADAFKYPPNVFDGFVPAAQRRLEHAFQEGQDKLRSAEQAAQTEREAAQAELATRRALQTELSQARQELVVLRSEAQAIRVQAEGARMAEQAAQARYDEVLHSTSWRVMAPVRRAVDLARGRLTPAHKQKIKRLLERSAQFVNRRPALKRQVMRVLNRFPRVRSRLANIVTRSFVADPGRHMAGVDAANLTPRARQALVDLKAAVERQAKGGVR